MSPDREPYSSFDAGLKKQVQDTIRSRLPPTNFDPLAVAQETLMELGFPTRPNPALQPAAYAFWRQMFAQPLEFEPFDFYLPMSLLVTRRAFFSQLRRRQSSQNWSGAYITPRDGTVFSSIWGKWQVPTPNVPPDGTPEQQYRSSTWIGFDGQRRYHQSTLPQFGTAQNIDRTGKTKPFFAWWQWWIRTPSGQTPPPFELAAPTIHPGDLIMCLMQVTDGRTGVSFVIKNLTTGRIVQFFQSAPQDETRHSFRVSGATAEWVMERSADWPNPTPLQLPDYGTVDFRDCGALAVNMTTGMTVERTLSAAKLIDMSIVKHKPERTARVSVTKSLGPTEFLTHFR